MRFEKNSAVKECDSAFRFAFLRVFVFTANQQLIFFRVLGSDTALKAGPLEAASSRPSNAKVLRKDRA